MLTQRITKDLVPPTVPLFAGGNPRDLVDVESVKFEMDIDCKFNDSLWLWLSKTITRASLAAEHYCSRVFVPALWQDQVWPAVDAYPWQLPPRIAPLQLRQFPILGGPSPAGTAPPQIPVLSYGSGGSLAAATYYVRISYVTPTGETALSLESSLSVPANALLNVANPGPDNFGLATSWNVYVSTKSFAETQQATGIGVNTNWTLPSSGLVTGSSPPQYVTVVENAPIAPTPLAEGVDFYVDAYHGQLIRLFETDLQPKSWNLPIVAIYWAGYTAIPDDLQDAVILMVKGRYYGRTRDPMIRSQNVEGVYEASYFFATGPGGQGDLSVDAMAKLDRYRVPVTA